jgi:hypothetical protein
MQYSPHEHTTDSSIQAPPLPVEIISHGVWLYFRFCLSYRDVEELLFALDVIGFLPRPTGKRYSRDLTAGRPS